MQRDDQARRLAEARRDALAAIAGRRSELTSVAEGAATEGRDDEHDPDGATVAFEHSLAMGLLERAEEHLQAVEAALGRWKGRTYGRCLVCEGEIVEARLAAEPAAPTCVRCSEASGPSLRARRLRSPRPRG